MSARRRVWLVAPLFLAVSTVAGAQDTTRVPSPVLLKRLAEAVDGNRTGRMVYVVASYESPNPVAGVYGVRDSAEMKARTAGKAFGVFGPYRAAAEQGDGDFIDPPGCVHDHFMSHRECPDTLTALSISSIRTMTLVITMKNGQTKRYALKPTTDALFMSMSAIDKFMLPYYERIEGAAAIADLRKKIAASIKTPAPAR